MAKPDAVVVVLVSDGRVLVIRRAPGVLSPGYWTPPSGRVEPGESQAETLVREAREELGVAVTPVAKVWECDTDDGAYRLHWWLGEFAEGVAGGVVGGELAPDPDEVAETRWVRPEDFRRLEPTFEGDHEFFDRVLPALLRQDRSEAHVGGG